MDLSVSEWADVLQQQALDTRQTSQELMVYVSLWREEPVLTLVSTNRDDALHAAYVAAVGADAERIGITFEGWRAREMTNPDTGKDWGPGEMSEYNEKHPENDVIYSGILTYVLARDGESVVKSAEIITGEHGSVAKPDEIDEVLEFRGYIPENLKAAMDQGTLSDMMPPGVAAKAEEALGHTRRYYHQDRAIIRELFDRNKIVAVMIFAVAGSEREALINEQVGDAESVMEGVDAYTADTFLTNHH